MSGIDAEPVPFDWKENSVVIPRQRAIAVYPSDSFTAIVLRQEGESGQPDAIIEVATRNCLELCATILRLGGDPRYRIVEIDQLVGGDGNSMRRTVVEKAFGDFLEREESRQKSADK